MRSPPSEPRSAVFRLDAGPVIGGGHAVRCSALADALALQFWHCTFAVASPGAETIRRLVGRRHDVQALPEGAEVDAAALVSSHPPCDLLVVDHYGWSAAEERACRGWARRIAVIDDLCDRDRDCDVLVNVGLDRKPDDYATFVPTDCRVLTGPGYALLRQQFANRRILRCGERKGVARVIVSFGLADTQNFSERALEALLAAGFSGKVDLVVGRDFPHLARVDAAARHGTLLLEVHVEPEDVASLVAAADLAIGAAGGSVWERCCLAVPSVVLSAAPNQDRNARSLAVRGACELAQDGDLAALLERLLHDPARIAGMASTAAAFTDGRGAARVVLAVDPEVTAKGRRVGLRRVTSDDAAQLYDWQRRPETRRHARNREVPSAAEHEAWLARKLSDPGCVLDLIEHEGVPAGSVRLDRTPPRGQRPACEVSIYVAPHLYGQGIGSAALAALRRLAPNVDLVAHVLPGNTASHALFAKAGYSLEHDLYISRPTTASG